MSPRLFAMMPRLFAIMVCLAAGPALATPQLAVIFPAKVSPKYVKQSDGAARLHTCLDQYNANKTANANGGLSWIQKGGGYYSQCSKRLRGS